MHSGILHFNRTLLDIFLEPSENAVIAPPGYPYESSNPANSVLWIVIGRPDTQIVAHVVGWIINSNLMIGPGYTFTFSHTNATMFDSIEIVWPSNTLTLLYKVKEEDYYSLGFIAHVTSTRGKISESS